MDQIKEFALIHMLRGKTDPKEYEDSISMCNKIEPESRRDA